MRNKQWLRYGLASFTLMGAACGMFLVACGDDDSSPVTPKGDSGADSTVEPDTGAPDTGTDANKPEAKPNAKLQLVNAATDFGPSNPIGALRVCYGLGPAGIAPLPPLPDRKSSAAQPFPGVYIGTGGAVQGTGADLTDIAITPYVMNAKTLADRGLVKPDAGAGTSCKDLFGVDAGGELKEGVDYWKLPEIAANTFVKEKSFILVLTGCAGDSTASAAKCGAGFTTGAPGNGNLKVTVYEVDRATAIDADKIGTQFIHASPAGASALGAFTPGYIGEAGEASFKPLVGDGGTPGAVAEKSELAQISGVNAATDSFTLKPDVAALALKLSAVQLASYGGNVPDGGDYRNGAALTFIALGDPAERAAGGTNTKTFHYIALPNDPVNETYKP